MWRLFNHLALRGKGDKPFARRNLKWNYLKKKTNKYNIVNFSKYK